MLQQEGAVLATLGGGTGIAVVLWNDPETYLGAVPQRVPVALEYVPQEVWCQRMVAAGVNTGNVAITAVTALGCTLQSDNPADISQFRVYARCRPQRTM